MGGFAGASRLTMAMEQPHPLSRTLLARIRSSIIWFPIANARPASRARSSRRSSGLSPSIVIVVGVISIASVASGCRSAISLFWNQPRRAAALYGTYVANNKFARETLRLNPDGTYIQHVTLKSNGRTTVARGNWRYDPETAYVTFDRHMMLVTGAFQRFNPNYAKPRKEGLVSLPVDRLFGQIRIGAAGDAAPYKKQ